VLVTDFPHEIHLTSYHAVDRIKSLRISEQQKEKSLGENAIELLKL
jgi:predicted TIM-barrel fold metal-dependent hydrolase